MAENGAVGFLKSLNGAYLRQPIYLRLPIACAVFCLILVAIQNPLIFPGAVLSVFSGTARDPSTLPPGVKSDFIETADGKSLEIWRYGPGRSEVSALIFHGNGGDLAMFFPLQEYFASIGIASYGIDYRGDGKSGGWPSERGLEMDADAAVAHVLESERMSTDNLLIFGESIGTGPASYAARKHSPRALVLLSPFVSLPDAMRTKHVVGILSGLSFYEFPVAKNVAGMQTPCVIVAHGTQDKVIPIAQGRAVFEGSKAPVSRFISSEEASHYDLIFRAHAEITKGIRDCFSGT